MTNSSNPWAVALIGHQLGEYSIVELLGEGNFGLVYRGEHVATGANVALKVLNPLRGTEAQAVEEFDNEAALLRKLIKRSHVINCLDSATELVAVGGGLPSPIKYHVLTEASGSLDELILDPVTFAALPWAERLSHWRGAILGVHQMHLSQIAHRDIKAANCLLMIGAKNSVEIRLTDLGRSKDFSLGPALPRNHYLAGRGDPAHAAPEFLHLQGTPLGADFCLADLYGLGSLLTELATGHSMTSLALGSWSDVLTASQQDFLNGVQRDLSTLRPQFRLAAQQAASLAPKSIRPHIESLLFQLCDPVPSARVPKRRGRPVAITETSRWLLARADILQKQLSVKAKPSNKRKTGA